MSKRIENNQFFDKFNTGITVIHVDDITLEFKLIYSNQMAREILKCKDEDETCIFSLKNVIKSSGDSIRSAFQNLYQVGYKKGECVVNTFDGVSILVDYQLLMFRDGQETYVQISLMRSNETISMEKKMDIIKTVDGWSFKEGYFGILYLVNADEIQRNYGEGKYREVLNLILAETKNIALENNSVQIVKDGIIAFVLDKNNENIEDDLKKLLVDIKQQIFKYGLNLLCKIKIGVSSNSKKKYAALHEAKFCLQKILHTGREYLIYKQPHEKQFINFLIKSDLPYAIKKNELDVHFQAIFDVEKKELFGFEALVRWNHNKYGIISPGEFIPLAEESELITVIDLWVFENALGKFRNEVYSANQDLKLNINISPRDFFDDSFVDQFLDIIKRSGVPCSNIILELTETLNLYPKRSSLLKLKNEGVVIALDDFGTGFASLSQIKNYHIDILKIDISFIRDINKDYNNTLITSAILSIANDLNINVIAEGVETFEQVNFLKSRKCRYIQGYRFHKPEGMKNLNLEKISTIHNHEIFGESIHSRESYVREYMYGKYIYMQLDFDQKILISNSRIEEISDVEINPKSFFEEVLEENVRQGFRKKFAEVFFRKGEMTTTSYTSKNGKIIPIVITMNQNFASKTIDVYIENYKDKNEDYVKLKNVFSRHDLIFDEVKSAIIFTDINFRVEEWNKTATEIFGYEKSEMIGKNLIKQLVPPEDQDLVNNIAYSTFMRGDTYNVNSNVTKSKKRILCEWKNTKLTDEKGEMVGLLSIVRDVTKENKTMEQLDLLSTVVRQDPSAILITDINGNIEFANESFANLTKYSLKELYGRNPRIFSSKEQSKEYYQNLWDTINNGEMWEGQFRNVKKDGSFYITESRIFPIKNNDGILKKFACIQHDVTERILNQSYLKEINQTLEDQERLSMVGQMAAGIMHEINNPLSFVDINVHALKEMLEDIRGDNGEVVESVELELKELACDLKDGISSIKRIASELKRFVYNSSSSDFEFVSLNQEIETVITISKNEYKYDSTVDFVMQEIDDIYADAGKIKQVILNILINAVHAIRSSKKDEFGLISIKTHQDDQYIYCEIMDNGPGIPDEIADKIFDAFFTTKENGKGSGLGLSLSKKIIEEDHKGKLYFETEKGVGTKFIIRFERFKKGEDEYV